MKHKISSVAIIISLIAIFLLGCGTPTGGPDQTAVNTPQTTIDFSDEYVFDLPPANTYDFGGKTVYIESYHKKFEEREEFKRTYALIQQINKMYNVNVEFIYPWEVDHLANAVAGVPSCDIGRIMSHQIRPYINSGGVEPLDNFLDILDIEDVRWDQDLNDIFYISNHQYLLGGRVQELNKYSSIVVCFMNKSMLDACDVNPDDLYTLQENKQWTWEKFAEYATKVTRDTNNDDVYDIYGCNIDGSYWDMALLASAQANLITRNDEGTYTFSGSQKIVDVINFLSSLIRSEAARPTYALSGQLSDGETDFYNSKVAFQATVFQRTWTTFLDMQDEYGVLCMPMEPSQNEYYMHDLLYDGYFIFTQPDKEWAKEIAKILYLYKTPLFADEADENKCFWLEAENRIFDEGSRYFLNIAFERKNIARSHDAAFLYQGLPFNYSEVLTGQKTAQTFLEENTPVINEFMKDFYKKD